MKILIFIFTFILILFACPLNPFPYKSIDESYQRGLHWGGRKIIRVMKQGFKLYYPWFWKYGSGQDPVFLSFLATTETAHTFNPLTGTKDTVLGECGLLSVKRKIARNYDIDCCNPKANIWAKSQWRYERIKRIDKRYKKYSFYKKMDYADRFLFYSIFETYPCFKSKSFAIAKAMQGKRFPDNHPYFVILNWIKRMDDKLHDSKYDYCWGRTSPEIAVFRFTRVKAVRDLIIRVYGGGKKGRKQWARCVRPEIPKPPNKGYPGDKLHGKCCPEWKPSSKGKACWNRWEKPPKYRRKRKKGKLIDLWAKWCLNESECSYERVFENWKKQKQAEGLLPSNDEYEQVKKEMKERGCWILKD